MTKGTFEAEFAKLDAKDGDVVVVGVGVYMPEGCIAYLRDAIARGCADAGRSVGVVVLDNDLTLSTVSEEAMREQGWVRAQDEKGED